MIPESQPKLRPPLAAKPDPVLRAVPITRPLLLKNFVPKLATAPPPEPAKPPAPASPPPQSAADPKQPEKFCRFCDKRAPGPIPPGWITVHRQVNPGSLLVPPGLSPREQHKREQNRHMMLGCFCGPDCLAKAMPRLSQFCQDLDRRGVGMRALALGENRRCCRRWSRTRTAGPF
jgi:hypothetical protein